MAKRFHCMFEQSGTFKKEFIKLGYQAYDYDILNDYGETDYQIDLFHEIEEAYENRPSIFDTIDKEDVTLAFFPCIRFEDQVQMLFRGTHKGMTGWTDIQKLDYDMELHKSLHDIYIYISKLAVIMLKRGLKMIIENPWSTTHYLTKYWPLKPALIDKDRREMGDYYTKPTQYWFINCKPSYNLIFEPQVLKEKKNIVDTRDKAERSLISPDYANRFIREYVL